MSDQPVISDGICLKTKKLRTTGSIELLAPARTADAGITAINYGADAVYIGAPKFGARAAVGNSIADIGRLISHAHLYHARVFIAFNTILFDDELEEAVRLIHQLYEAGADALIIQDMGLLEAGLPPIELHASTQTNNYDPAKIRFLEKVGFSRVILARELTLEQIREISKVTTVELESFVHGALCVSMSGQCYLSQSAGGRSGNRGVCAQPCRKTYDLLDADGRVVVRNQHLLSLKDLDLSDHLEELALAGISSFKIEGRLKDDNYLKNTTARYRQRIDAMLEGKPGFRKASSGTVYFDFTPDPAKTFSRGSSNYFLHGRSQNSSSFGTSKSTGEPVGTVLSSDGRNLRVKTTCELHNNDGLAFFAVDGTLQGCKVNVAAGSSVVLAEARTIPPGTPLFRNYDHQFFETLKKSRTIRKIGLTLEVQECDAGLLLAGRDEAGQEFSQEFPLEKTAAEKPERAAETLKTQLEKTGESPFEIRSVNLLWQTPLFLPASVINQLRRSFLENFARHRQVHHPRKTVFFEKNQELFPETAVDYRGNVANRLARQFYQRHQATVSEAALEISREYSGKQLMTMKHCLKYQLGFCPKEKTGQSGHFREPFFLSDGLRKYRLGFDCQSCRMNLYYD